ncbi:hypothetical protein AGRO_1197 [Agrobacterium sp. ATCC 31749]|nr:hypothetical protein AGRO_1197 [Agrobacterium sp. ATCC 31749]
MSVFISLRGLPRGLFYGHSFEDVCLVWARIEGMSAAE